MGLKTTDQAPRRMNCNLMSAYVDQRRGRRVILANLPSGTTLFRAHSPQTQH